MANSSDGMFSASSVIFTLDGAWNGVGSDDVLTTESIASVIGGVRRAYGNLWCGYAEIATIPKCNEKYTEMICVKC